ncbi:MAG: hypothetical protein ACKO2P_00815 [Planctomycetota bacterium]
MKSTMHNTSNSPSTVSQKPSPFRRWLLLPLGLALVLTATDLIVHSQSQTWLLGRMQAADNWLLSVFTADIDNSASEQPIPPKEITSTADSPVLALEMQLLAPPELLAAAGQSQQPAAAPSLTGDTSDASATPQQTTADTRLQLAAKAAADPAGNRQICRVVLAGTALTGTPQPDGTWHLQPGSLQQTLVIPDPTGALHPAGRLDTKLPPEHRQSTYHVGTLQLNPQQNSVNIVWTDVWGAAATRHSFQATFITGTPADLALGRPVELEPDANSARFLQDLLAERLRPLLSERLQGTPETAQITAELATPGNTRIRIEADQLSWSFRSAATVRLHRTPDPSAAQRQ